MFHSFPRHQKPMNKQFHWHHRGEISVSLLILLQHPMLRSILRPISRTHLGWTHLPSHCSHWHLIPLHPMLRLQIHLMLQVPRTLPMYSNLHWLRPDLQDQPAAPILQGYQQPLWLRPIKITVATPLELDRTVQDPDHHQVQWAIGMAKRLMTYSLSLMIMKYQAGSLVSFVGKLLISSIIFKMRWLIKLKARNWQLANIHMSRILPTAVVQRH